MALIKALAELPFPSFSGRHEVWFVSTSLYARHDGRLWVRLVSVDHPDLSWWAHVETLEFENMEERQRAGLPPLLQPLPDHWEERELIALTEQEMAEAEEQERVRIAEEAEAQAELDRAEVERINAANQVEPEEGHPYEHE